MVLKALKNPPLFEDKSTFCPFLVLNGKELQPTTAVWSWEQDEPYQQHLLLTLKYGKEFTEEFHFSAMYEGYVVRRTVQNVSGEWREVNELGLRITDLSFGGESRDDYFYHNENPRIYEVMTFPLDYRRTAKDAKDARFDFQAGNRWADPGVVHERIGRSPYQPFPAILLSNYATSDGFVHGTLSQKLCYHNYLAAHGKNGSITLTAFSSFKALSSLRTAPGRILEDEFFIGYVHECDNIERAFGEFPDILREYLPLQRGAMDVNRYSLVWGSWNDGIFRNISEDMLLEEARFLKKNFPTVKWIQVDDGYAVNVPPAHGLGVPYEGDAGVDQKKFPNGLRHFTNQVKLLGLRPAVWIGGFCCKKTPIYKDHPEWFIDYDYRVESSAPLDPSKAEVRKYMTYALDKLITEYGFDGVKQDFWSYAFEDSNDLYRGERERSGYEMRDWWLKEFRKRLPQDAHFQTGCDIVMGNPFLGEFYSNYRYGIDIGSGAWDNVKTNFLWGAACFATHTGDLIVPNSDGVGLFPGLSDDEALFCLNYCLITHSMVELAGRLSKAPADSPRLAALRKATCCPNNGVDIYFARYNYRDQKNRIPKIFWNLFPHFSCTEDGQCLPIRSVAIFNCEDKPATVAFDLQDLKLDLNAADHFQLTDIWSGETILFAKEVSFKLPPHGSRFFQVSYVDGPQVLDANFRIQIAIQVLQKRRALMLYTDYDVDMNNAELRLSFTPAYVKINNRKMKYLFQDGLLHINKLPAFAEIELGLE